VSSFDLTLTYMLAAVIGVVVCRSFKLPPMLGYLSAGVLIGPHAFAFAQNSEGTRHLGEFGVVFLMFLIGLEFNLPKLRAMRKHVFGLGLLQVVSTMVVVTAGAWWIVSWLPARWQLGWQTMLVLSGALAMSSTAIIVKLMAERLELESEHGKRVFGVLLFQDLAVVPLLVLIPALGAPPETMLRAIGFAMLKAGLLITVLLYGGPRIMRWWLTLVARQRSEELFMLNLLLVTLSLAWLTNLAGLSLELGAFVAGMLVAETEYKHQVETDIRPFHDILLGLFFITIGMSLDWHVIVQHWALVGLFLLPPLAFKLALVTGLARALGATAGVSLRTGLYLAQAGEFGFVLLAVAQGKGLLPEWLLNPVLAAMVVSMLATPFIVMNAERIVRKLVASDWLQQSLQMTNIARQTINTSRHVIICGYGRCGQNLARMLEREGIAYLAFDLDPDRVRQAAAAGDSVVFGDVARPQTLMAAGLARARAVVVSYQDTPSALRVLAHVRRHAPQVPVLVRTRDDHDIEKLQAAGAAEVVPEAIEGSLMLASHALALIGVPMRRVIRVIQEQRDARYSLLRGYFHGADDDTVDEVDHERLNSFTVSTGARAIGMSLAQLALETLGVRVASLRRRNGKAAEVNGDAVLADGDTLVLSGKPGALAMAIDRLQKG
jgi:CPA2 family monovalent cation:H+ antiporter-2